MSIVCIYHFSGHYIAIFQEKHSSLAVLMWYLSIHNKRPFSTFSEHPEHFKGRIVLVLGATVH